MSPQTYLHTEVIPTQVDDAVATYRAWRQIVRDLNGMYTAERYAAERRAYTRVLSFPPMVMSQAMNQVNRGGE
jgi:hypothetical protein